LIPFNPVPAGSQYHERSLLLDYNLHQTSIITGPEYKLWTPEKRVERGLRRDGAKKEG
jgi:hypothetical protein